MAIPTKPFFETWLGNTLPASACCRMSAGASTLLENAFGSSQKCVLPSSDEPEFGLMDS